MLRNQNCRHFVDTTVDIFPIISLYFLRTLSTFFFICARKANCRHFVDTRSTFSLSFLCIFCGHCQHFFSLGLGKQTVDILSTLRSTFSLSFLCIFCGHCQHFFSFVLGKQTVDILSTLGRHFPYHFFVFSADTDNIFFHLCSESKLSTFCRHSVDIFPIISLYFLRTLSTFFFICARKANCRHFVDNRSTFSLSFLCIFCGHCQHFFSLGLGKQTVDILPTLGRHFPYHFFVFSADTVNTFFHLRSESKLSTFCRHSVDIFLSFLCIFCGQCQHFFSLGCSYGSGLERHNAGDFGFCFSNREA